jgi:hypothetical protein
MHVLLLERAAAHLGGQMRVQYTQQQSRRPRSLLAPIARAAARLQVQMHAQLLPRGVGLHAMYQGALLKLWMRSTQFKGRSGATVQCCRA